MHVVDMVFFWARAEPDRLAIIQPETVITFQGLADAIESISDRIDQLGLDPHEPVAVSLANPSHSLATIFALFRCGYSVAPVNGPLLLHLRSAGIHNLIYDNQGLVLAGGRNIRFHESWLPQKLPTERRFLRRPIGKVDTILFTSGSTGLPKKFVQTSAGLEGRIVHQNVNALSTRQKALIIAGLSSAYGFNAACELLYPGKTACFAPSGEAALRLISTFGIDSLIASPLQAFELAKLKDQMPDYNLSSLQVILLGGASVGRDGVKQIRSALCRNVINKYASTEAGIAALAPLHLLPDIPGATGFLAPWADVEIVDETGAALPNGSEGLIRYRTPQFTGNLENADAPATADAEGKQWFCPGDVGYVTDDGVLCLTGRRSDLINRGGIKVSITKIEEALEALPEIREASACGMEGRSGFEEIWVAIVPQAPIDISEIRQHLKDHSDVGVMVDEVFEVRQLPRGDLGKVQRHMLKEMMLRLKEGA